MPQIDGRQIRDGSIEGVDIKDGTLTAADFGIDITWKSPVNTIELLPSNSNNAGDARVVKSTNLIYIWDGSNWITGTASSNVAWDNITNKPLEFNPSSHNHTSANISDATALNTANMIVERDASGNFAAGTITASLTGNASTATTIQTARTINGVSFNGSANIGQDLQTTASPTFTTVNASLSGNASTSSKVVNASPDGIVTDLIYTTMGTNDYFRISVGGANNAGYVELATADDGTEPIYVRQYTGVFTALVRTATLLDGAGNTIFPGNMSAVSITESSSIKLKENILPIENALSNITKLQGVEYNRIGKTEKEAGLIAEEVDKVLPLVVARDENGEATGIHYTKLTVYLIEAVKELKNEIEELKVKYGDIT